MNIKKIVLSNIRCYDYFEFEPSPTGVTAISGDNGSGKSTIVDAFAWCLFGKKLNGLNTKTWIKEGKDPENGDLVEVKSYITHGGKDYLIRREILNNTGTQIAHLYEYQNGEWVEQSGPAVTHTEALVRQILGVDEGGFLTATFVAQKEVDSIINTSPRERGKIIEKLIGIESLTKSIELAKRKSKDLQKVIQVIDPGDLDEIKRAISEKRQEVEQLKKDLQENVSSYNSVSAILQELSKEAEEEKSKREIIKEKQAQLERIKSNIRIESSHLDSYIEDLKGIDTDHSISSVSLEELEEELQEQDRVIKDLSFREHTLQEKIDKSKKVLEYSIEETLEKNIEEIGKALKEENDSLQADKEEAVTIKSSIKSKEVALESLSGEEEECPLCGEHITNPKHLIEEYQSAKESLQRSLEETLERIEESTKKVKELEEKQRNLQEEFQKKLLQDKIKEELPKLQEEINKTQMDMLAIKAENKVLSKRRDTVKSNEVKKELLESTKRKIEEAKNRIKELLEEEKEITSEISSVDIAEDEFYKELLKNLQEKEDEVDILKKDNLVLRERYKYEIQIAKDMVENYKKTKKAKEEYDEISTSLEIANSTTRLLSRFKEERARYSVPMLTVIASDILNRFTDGELMQVMLSETFDVSVRTKDGQIRLVKQLSGGELSSVSIALRLAIALFLQEGRSGLLILDEILVSMSEERATLILTTIQELSNSQIIFIAHNGSVNSVADRIVEL